MPHIHISCALMPLSQLLMTVHSMPSHALYMPHLSPHPCHGVACAIHPLLHALIYTSPCTLGHVSCTSCLHPLTHTLIHAWCACAFVHSCPCHACTLVLMRPFSPHLVHGCTLPTHTSTMPHPHLCFLVPHPSHASPTPFSMAVHAHACPHLIYAFPHHHPHLCTNLLHPCMHTPPPCHTLSPCSWLHALFLPVHAHAMLAPSYITHLTLDPVHPLLHMPRNTCALGLWMPAPFP